MKKIDGNGIIGSLLQNTQPLQRETNAGVKACGASTVATTSVEREHRQPRTTATFKFKFMPGDRFVAPVKTVNASGVYVQMPGGKGAGVLSPRCWGGGAQRQTALSMLHPGSLVAVIVRQFHEPTMVANLELDGDGSVPGATDFLSAPVPSVVSPVATVAKAFSRNGSTSAKAPKPEFRPLATGTILLLDCANLFGVLRPEHAAHKLRTIGEALRRLGYGVAFFLEKRTKTWLLKHQSSAADEDALVAFCREPNVMLVEGEADLPILQVARVLTDSVCVSRDHFGNYASVFRDIADSPRRRSFACIMIGEVEALCIDGLAEAILLVPPSGETPDGDGTERTTSETGPETPDGEAAEEPDEPAADEAEVAALVRRGLRMMEKGEAERCERYIGRMAPTRAEGYRAMAEIYETGLGGNPDAKKAKKYRRMAERDERRQRQCARRRVRLYAQWVESGRRSVLRMSSGQRTALAMEGLRRKDREKTLRHVA